MANKNILKSGLHALVWKERKLFVAKCVEVEVASQAKTRSQALTNLEEAVELYFEDEKVKTPTLSHLELIPLSGKLGYA